MSSDRSTSSSSHQITQNEDQLKQKRKRTTYTIFGVIVALIASTLVESYFLEAEANTSIANNILILAVFNIIIILLFVLIILITRNLVKVYNERKSKIIGSKFQTKLVIAFLILALVPSILLFAVASKLFSFSIGNWFNLRTEQTLQFSMDIARDYYSEFEDRALSKTKNIELFIKENSLYLKTYRKELNTLIQNKTAEYNLAGIIIYDDNLKKIASKIDSTILPSTEKLSHENLIQKSIDGEGFSEIQTIQGKSLMVVVVPLTEIVNTEMTIWGYILTITPSYKNSFGKVELIKNTYQDYKQQKFLQLPVSANYHITFLLITLLILFSAIWLGFYMARGITIPIQQLAEGTRRIADGDLNFRIGVRATDEIALLVDSFNTMTKELNESRVGIQQINQNLKQTNIELDRRRNYIETILDNIGAGVISINKKGQITTFNKAAENILQLDNENIFGSTYKEAFDQSYHEPIRKLIQKMHTQNKNSIEEQMEIRVKGTNINLLINIQVLAGVSKKYRGMVIVFEDLTQLIKAQKIAAWKEVAQGIAHEIKNPLTPIQLNTQRLKKKYYQSQDDFAKVFDESISIITKEIEGMKDLLNEFLRFSRMPAPKPKISSLHEIINNILISYSEHEKKIRIKKNFDPDLNAMNIDPEQIRRVLINLFENATDALEEGGLIQIQTKILDDKKSVRIYFSDDGTGVLTTDRDKLFLPHFTTKRRGSGLGLAIVNRIIIDHNGTIKAQDNHPRGTTFIIELPYTENDLKLQNSLA